MKEMKAHEVTMKITVRYLALSFVILATQQTLSAQTIRLRAGTLLRCTLEEPSFSSKSAEIGDPLICYAGPLHEFGRSVTKSRAHWLGHPNLFASEVRVHPAMSVILGTRKAPQGGNA